jgi:hypothetical protein
MKPDSNRNKMNQIAIVTACDIKIHFKANFHLRLSLLSRMFLDD